MSSRPLNDTEIEFFARQIIVPGIGAAGQAKLCASRVALAGEPEGVEAAELWLRSLGCRVVGADALSECAIVAGVRDVGAYPIRKIRDAPLVWYVLDAGHLTAGVVMPGGALPDFQSMRSPHIAPARLHRIAACDAAATAAALILGWEDVDLHYEVDLA